MQNKKISIIIPVFNEEGIKEFIPDLLKKSDKYNIEIIVVDGDSSGSTISKLKNFPVKTIISPKGRGIQLEKGAKNSTGELLLFLHADTQLPEDFYPVIISACFNITPCGAFRIKIGSDRFIFRILEFFANMRAKYLGMPFGDQAMFISREAYEKTGGFSPIPIFEDVDIVRRLKMNNYHIHILDRQVLTSARRWEKEGILRTTLRNWYLQMLYFIFKINPHKLKKFYRSP
jgi:rSAM/selenodomain-associated transferase 2